MKVSGSRQNFSPPAAMNKKNASCLGEIQRLQRERDERRKKAEDNKNEKISEDARNKEAGNPGDVDFQRMIRAYREAPSSPMEMDHHPSSMADKITICIRKRPINQKEVRRNDYDCVTCLHPLVIVHDCKMRVDGISKYLDNTAFQFDHTFHEENTTEEVYLCAVQPLVDFVVRGGRATVFAYGQTGSGKTHTMVGIQSLMNEDLFDALNGEECYINTQVTVSFFEIYGGRCQDLLNNRNRLIVREDGQGDVVVGDLTEIPVDTKVSLEAVIDAGNKNRTTFATESNDVSSRSHAICQITLYDTSKNSVASTYGAVVGRLSLIDLAGSERGADTQSNNRQRRMEGAEINKSLLALKECIRALDTQSGHVPYRGSKLTLVLKDSFTRAKAKTVMITTISPAATSADHTINSLRYADRVKEKTVGSNHERGNAGPPMVVARSVPQSTPSHAPSHSTAHSGSAESKKPQLTPPVPSKTTPTQSHPQSVPARKNVNSNISGRKGSDRDNDVAEEKHMRPAENNVRARGNRRTSPEREVDEMSETLHSALVENLFDEEEALLNLHMNVIQENAELLTEEGRLLQQIQGDDNDIDAYATRLDEILRRKQDLVTLLRAKLMRFRQRLLEEESIFRS